MPKFANTFHVKDKRVVEFSAGKKHCSWWCGASASQAEVVQSACGAARCVCVETWSMHSKLLANQLKDGDSQFRVLLQAFVKEAGKALWKA